MIASVLFLAATATAPADVSATRTVENERRGTPSRGAEDDAYLHVEARYVHAFLSRHPVVSTYLGGSGLDPALAAADGQLRDWSPAALAAETKTFAEIRGQLEKIDPARLTPAHRIDRDVALHQIEFLRHWSQDRKAWRRCVDTYVNEAFRGIDWSMQGMTELGNGRLGSDAEWRRVIERAQAVPAYLAQAQANLEAGKAAGDLPDWRMVEKDGIASSEENARYFEKDLSEQAAERTKGQPFAATVVGDLKKAGTEAAAAFRKFAAFLQGTLAKLPKTDRFAFGEAEYNWALKNNLALDTTAAKLFEEAPVAIDATRNALVETAQRIAEKRGLKDLAWDKEHREASTRAVMDLLSQEYPRSDAEMIAGYREVGVRLVEFARKTGIFDVPPDYKLDVTVVPPALESAIEGAAYYPAPTFKDAGVGRFYVAPPHEDDAKLRRHNRAAMAYLAAHEGFPGHDWNYKVMGQYRKEIGPVRWFTPGEVEGSASMWQDSVASEGWGLYSESLMGEPAPGAPDGFYTLEERLYQLRGQLTRDWRVRVDTGLHLGRISFDEAVNLNSQILDFLPGSCQASDLAAAKKASCATSENTILRYSKWPTQAITYRLGKHQILALRAKAEAIVPGLPGRKRFHLLFMQQGTIPPAYFADELLKAMAVAPSGERR
jgi:uncharacterized protein (DUF885 family)